MTKESIRFRALGGRMWIQWPAVIVLAFLALHSVSYGIGFLTDPTAGAGEFGDNDPSTAAAENLAGLVGVILLLVATTATIAAVMLVRRHVSGAWLALGLGVSLISIGLYWASRDNVWDAGLYGFVGAVLVVLGGLIARHAFSPGRGTDVNEASQESNQRASA